MNEQTRAHVWVVECVSTWLSQQERERKGSVHVSEWNVQTELPLLSLPPQDPPAAATSRLWATVC